jgi:hypothetical protein
MSEKSFFMISYRNYYGSDQIPTANLFKIKTGQHPSTLTKAADTSSLNVQGVLWTVDIQLINEFYLVMNPERRAGS